MKIVDCQLSIFNWPLETDDLQPRILPIARSTNAGNN
jgi:hypothetical protein